MGLGGHSITSLFDPSGRRGGDKMGHSQSPPLRDGTVNGTWSQLVRVPDGAASREGSTCLSPPRCPN